jgi:hypothetical protein
MEYDTEETIIGFAIAMYIDATHLIFNQYFAYGFSFDHQ